HTRSWGTATRPRRRAEPLRGWQGLLAGPAGLRPSIRLAPSRRRAYRRTGSARPQDPGRITNEPGDPRPQGRALGAPTRINAWRHVRPRREAPEQPQTRCTLPYCVRKMRTGRSAAVQEPPEERLLAFPNS